MNSLPDTKATIAETKHVVELWKTMNNTKMPTPLKEIYQRMAQEMVESLRESLKVVSKGEDWFQNGLQMWNESEIQTFQKDYARKGREEAEAVTAALRKTRKAINEICQEYLEKEGKSGRSTTMTPALMETVRKIADCPRERMNFSSLIKWWSSVGDEFSCIEMNLGSMDPAISFYREQVNAQWQTIGQMYANYATEFMLTELQHDIEFTQKKPSGWGKMSSRFR